MMKTNIYRVRFVGRDYEDAQDENGVLIRNKTPQEVIDERLDADERSTFIFMRQFSGETEILIREPVQ